MYEGAWLRVNNLVYQHGSHTFTWESIERTRQATILVIIAKLIPSERYILIRQFRPGYGNHVMGLPAGLCYCRDFAAEALRELKEETGYTGSVLSVSPELAFNPAISNEKLYIVRADVDENNSVNLNPVQQLEPEEDITVFPVPQNELTSFLALHKSQGTAISAALWYLSLAA